MNIKIYIATHKVYTMPDDKVYEPIHVGNVGKELNQGYTSDAVGENISAKNDGFCELTGLYWAWKNSDADYIGLVHYRRHFSSRRICTKNENLKFKFIASSQEIETALKKADIILPKKRRYFIENLYSHYKNTLYVEPLDITGDIIIEKYPKYSEEFEKLHSRTSAHMFNMLIMKKNYLDEYCEWLFDILFELEVRMENHEYDKFHSRYFGRVSELLLDVWINTNAYDYSELRVMDMNSINWPGKIKAFLLAKFFKRKYTASFK